MKEELRFTGLRAPSLLDSQRAALAEAEGMSLELSVDAVLAAAKERTGLDSFGPDDFIDRLQLLLDVVAWEGHTKLTQVSAFERIVGKAINRQLMFDLLQRHPEILEEEITAPILVCGLPRSGTTHLLNLMAADSRCQSLPYWEVLRPIPLLAEDALVPGEPDPRWQRAQLAWERLQRENPLAAAHHPMDPGHISEDGELQMQDFSSYVWEFSLHAPAWRDYYLAHDQTPHYAFEKTMLQILQWQRGSNRRWLLKAPQHIEQLPAIMRVFPDATVVITHRDPVASLQSIATQAAYMDRIRRVEPDPDETLAYWADRVCHLLSALVRDGEAVPAAQRFDCIYREFVGKDVETVGAIYSRAGIEMTDTARAELDAYMESHGQGHSGRIVYDLRSDFGAEPATLRQRYAEYLELFPVEAEVR
jgi:hypothetical protein